VGYVWEEHGVSIGGVRIFLEWGSELGLEALVYYRGPVFLADFEIIRIEAVRRQIFEGIKERISSVSRLERLVRFLGIG